MATTYDTIISNIQAVLPNLNSTSLERMFGNIARAIGISIDNTLSELDNTKAEITSIIGNQRYGRSGYYVEKALAYQDGDNLVIDPVTLDYIYAVIDPTKQIIVQAAFESVLTGGAQILTLKVARIDPDTGNLAALTSLQKTAFDSYFTTYEIPGLPVSKVSISPNILNFNAIVTYYATFDYNTLVSGVVAALFAFRDSYRFNGELFTNDIETYVVNNVPGVRNISLTDTTIDSVAFQGSIKLLAGYFDFAANIENNLTYTPL